MAKKHDKLSGRAIIRSLDELMSLDEGTVFEVHGVDDPRCSAAGSRGPRQKNWTFLATLVVWKSPRGPVIHDPLKIRQAVGEPKLSQLMKAFRDDIVKLKLRIAYDKKSKSKVCEIVTPLGKSNSAILKSQLKRLTKPTVIKDPVFGTLKYPSDGFGFESKAKWNGKMVRVEFVSDSPSDDISKLLKFAARVWKSQKQWDQRARKRIQRELSTDKWTHSLDDEIDAVVLKKLEARLAPISVSFFQDEESPAGFEIHFDPKLSEFDDHICSLQTHSKSKFDEFELEYLG